MQTMFQIAKDSLTINIHLRSCDEMNIGKLFSSQIAFYTASDFAFTAIIYGEMLQVELNGQWGNDDKGDLYFLTDDCAGCNPENGEKLGPGIRIHTGGDALVGRIASKVYVVLMTTVRPESKKIPTAMVYLDMSKRVQFKVEIFANIFTKYFERNIWGRDDEANEYLTHVGEALYKYFDAVSNTVKPFCYRITERQKERVRNGLIYSNIT